MAVYSTETEEKAGQKVICEQGDGPAHMGPSFLHIQIKEETL
jgi:hypothetical protein